MGGGSGGGGRGGRSGGGGGPDMTTPPDKMTKDQIAGELGKIETAIRENEAAMKSYVADYMNRRETMSDSEKRASFAKKKIIRDQRYALDDRQKALRAARY